MQKDSQIARPSRPWWHIGAGLAGLVAIAWLTWTFTELVETHTRHAQAVSHSAGWAGQPVGVMPQDQGVVHNVYYDTTLPKDSEAAHR